MQASFVNVQETFDMVLFKSRQEKLMQILKVQMDIKLQLRAVSHMKKGRIMHFMRQYTHCYFR